MDTTQTTTHISLCTGYAGIDLGLKRCIPNLRTVAYSEIEAFACENLLARMEAGQLDPAPIWTDLKSFPWAEFSGRVDILSGGYPCQPFSAAGKRLGAEDPRHLWPYIASGIRLLRPRVCFFENVEGHISLGLSTVISDLEELGYTVSWGVFSAAECGAPHQRKRVFIMAHRNDARLEGLRECATSQGRETPFGHAGGRCDVWPSRPGEPQHAWEPPRVLADSRCGQRSRGEIIKGTICSRESKFGKTGEIVANTASERAGSRQQLCDEDGRQGRTLPCESDESGEIVGNAPGGTRLGRASGDERHAAQPDEAGGNRQTQSTLGGDTDGPASGLDYAELCVTCDNRTDELRLLGNGVVPATAEKAFRTLLKQLWT